MVGDGSQSEGVSLAADLQRGQAMKKLSQKERNFRISQGVKAAWRRKHSVKDTLADFRDSLSPFHAGIAFVKASGGMENAKATIALIEQVREVL